MVLILLTRQGRCEIWLTGPVLVHPASQPSHGMSRGSLDEALIFHTKSIQEYHLTLVVQSSIELSNILLVQSPELKDLRGDR